MGKWRPWKCKVCGRSDVRISRRGLCATHAIERQTFVAVELHNKSGPNYDRWVDAMKKATSEL